MSRMCLGKLSIANELTHLYFKCTKFFQLDLIVLPKGNISTVTFLINSNLTINYYKMHNIKTYCK